MAAGAKDERRSKVGVISIANNKYKLLPVVLLVVLGAPTVTFHNVL